MRFLNKRTHIFLFLIYARYMLILYITISVIVLFLLLPIFARFTFNYDIDHIDTRVTIRIFGIKIYSQQLDYSKITLPQKDYTFLIKALTIREFYYFRTIKISKLNEKNIIVNFIISQVLGFLNHNGKARINSGVAFDINRNNVNVEVAFFTSIIRIVICLLQNRSKYESNRPNSTNS